MDPTTLTVAMVARQLSMSPKWVRKQINTGRLRAVKTPGGRGRWLVFADSVDAFLGLRTRRRRPSEAEDLRRADAAMARLGFSAPGSAVAGGS